MEYLKKNWKDRINDYNKTVSKLDKNTFAFYIDIILIYFPLSKYGHCIFELNLNYPYGRLTDSL